MEKDITLLLIGAGISIVSSFLTLYINRLLDRIGKLRIFHKIVCLPGGEEGGFYVDNDADMPTFTVPISFEFQNTSNSPRIIRNLNIYLYNDNVFVSKMVQAEQVINTKTSRNNPPIIKEYNFGADHGMYSFLVSPHSISAYNCLFTLSIPYSKINEYTFNHLRLTYNNEKDHKKELFLFNFNGNWKDALLPYEFDWSSPKYWRE